MQILVSKLYEQQLKKLLEEFIKEDYTAAKKFKLYLDTIIINLPTKAHKYKKSRYFDDENIKEIPHENYTVVFHVDSTKSIYLILAIMENEK